MTPDSSSSPDFSDLGGTAVAAPDPSGGDGIDFSDLGGQQLPGTESSLTPETDRAIAASGSIWNKIISAAKAPSPEWIRPAEKVIKDVATYQIPGVAEANPIYWMGRYNQAIAPLVTSTVGVPAGKVTELSGNAAVGLSKGIAKMATPMNVGLALAAPETALGKAAISGIFTGQAVAQTPQMVEQLKKDYASGNVGALTEHAAELAGAYLPAAHFVPGLGGKAKTSEGEAPAAPEQPSQPGPRGFTTQGEPYFKVGGNAYRFDENLNRYVDESGKPVEDEAQIEKLSKAEEQQTAATPSKKSAKPVESDADAERRARMLMERYANLAGEPEGLFKDMTDVAGVEPTWTEYADELQKEISKLTATPELAMRAFTEGVAKRRGITPEQVDAEFGQQEIQGRLRTIEEMRDAGLSRSELAEEKKQKGGKYAKQPSYAQMEGGYPPLRVETRPSGAEPPAGNRYNVGREAQGEGARRNVPGEEPVSTGTPLVPKTSGPTTGLDLELENRAKHRIEQQLKLPKDPVELLKLQEEDLAPSNSEIARLVRIEKKRLLKEREQKAKSSIPVEEEERPEPPKAHPMSPGLRPGFRPVSHHPTESGKPGAREAILNARELGLSLEDYRKWREGTLDVELTDDAIAERQAKLGITKESLRRPFEPKPAKERTFRVKTSVDEFANSPETPVSTAVSEMGGIISKTAAQKAGKYEGNEAQWNDAAKLSHPSHNKIYNPKGEMPDVMAQNLYDAGLIKDPSADAMNRAMEKESAGIRGKRKATTPETEFKGQIKQAENFGKAQLVEQESGTGAVAARGLSIGDTVDVDGSKLKVIDVDPEGTVTLEDGKRFGIQEVADNDIIYGEVEQAKPLVEETAPKAEAPAVEPQKFSTKTHFKKVGDSRYEHKQTKLIINKGKEGGWDARHPTTGEVIANYPSRQAAMEAHADGGSVPISVEGKKLRLKANNEGGFVNAEIIKEATDFGKRLMARGLDYAKWAKEMVKHLGQKIAAHLKGIWENLTGGRTRPGFRESGEIGRTGEPGRGLGKPQEFRRGYGKPENMAEASRQANARLEANPRHADKLISDLTSGKKTGIDTADQQVLVQHRAMLQGARDRAASMMNNKQFSDGDRAEAAATFEDLDSQIRSLDQAVREGLLIKSPMQQSLWHNFRSKDYSLESMRDKLFAAKNGKPVTREEQARLEKHTARLSDMMARIEGLKRTSGWKPGVTPPPPGMRGLQHDAFQSKIALDHMIFEAKYRNKPLAKRMWLTGREVLAIPRALMASMDLSAVRRQGGILFLSHPIRSLKTFPDMLRAARSDQEYFRLMQDIRERPNAELYKSSKLGLTDIQTPKLENMEEQYMSRWAEKIPLVAHSQRAYVYYLNRLRADSFDAMAKTLSRKGSVSETQAKVISNFLNVFTGRGAVNSHKAMAAMVAMNDAFFAPRYTLSRFQAITAQPLRFALKNKEARAMIAQEYARALIGYGIVYGIVGTTLKGIATVEWDPRSTDFGKIKIGNTRIDIMSGLSQPTVLLSRLITRHTKQQSGKIEPLFAGGRSRSARMIGDVVKDFAQSKLAPVPAFLWNVEEGKKVTGEPTQLLPKGTPFTPGFEEGELLRVITPLSGSDIVNALVEYGVPKGAALGMLAFFGDSVNTYSPHAHTMRVRKHHR